MKTCEGIHLTAVDKWDNLIILTEATYLAHTDDKGLVNGGMRKRALSRVPDVLRDPRYVYNDTGHPGRIKYADLLADPDVSPRMGLLVVVVDPQSTPWEMSTWIWKARVSQEDFTGGIIYDAAKDADTGS